MVYYLTFRTIADFVLVALIAILLVLICIVILPFSIIIALVEWIAEKVKDAEGR